VCVRARVCMCVSLLEESSKTLMFNSSGLGSLTTSEGSTDVFSNIYIFVEELSVCPLKNWSLSYMTAYFMTL
jgi:hypothetical protein